MRALIATIRTKHREAIEQNEREISIREAAKQFLARPEGKNSWLG
jgi:hypothetical protein